MSAFTSLRVERSASGEKPLGDELTGAFGRSELVALDREDRRDYRNCAGLDRVPSRGLAGIAGRR